MAQYKKSALESIGQYVLMATYLFFFAYVAFYVVRFAWTHPKCWVWLGLVVAVLVALWLWRRIGRAREFRRLRKRGVDFGLRKESLEFVDTLLAKYGKPCQTAPKGLENVAPQVRELAARYRSVRFNKKTLFANRDLQNVFSFKKNEAAGYFEIAREDSESLYVVRQSPTEETVYYVEIEWMPEPVPYASDIRHYLALRCQESGVSGELEKV